MVARGTSKNGRFWVFGRFLIQDAIDDVETLAERSYGVYGQSLLDGFLK